MAAALQLLSTFSVTNRCYFCPTLPMHLLLRVHDDDDDDDKGVTRRQSPPIASSWSVVSGGLRSSSLLWNSFEGQHEVSLLSSEEMRFASKCFGTWRITTNHLVVCDDGVFWFQRSKGWRKSGAWIGITYRTHVEKDAACAPGVVEL